MTTTPGRKLDSSSTVRTTGYWKERACLLGRAYVAYPTPISPPGFRANTNLTMNGLLSSWSTTAVADVARLPLVWQGEFKMNVEGYGDVNPAMRCNSTVGGQPCIFNASAPPQANATLSSGRSDAVWGAYLASANTVWVHGKGLNFIATDSSARFRTLNPSGAAGPHTDGETYGHHHRFAEMALARVVTDLDATRGVLVENYASLLANHPATDDVEIVAPSAWSCAHGVERWRSNCSCRMRDGTNQEWRTPLRDALTELAGGIHAVYEREASRYFDDPWAVRDAYGEVVATPERIESWVGSRLRASVAKTGPGSSNSDSRHSRFPARSAGAAGNGAWRAPHFHIVRVVLRRHWWPRADRGAAVRRAGDRACGRGRSATGGDISRSVGRCDKQRAGRWHRTRRLSDDGEAEARSVRAACRFRGGCAVGRCRRSAGDRHQRGAGSARDGWNRHRPPIPHGCSRHVRRSDRGHVEQRGARVGGVAHALTCPRWRRAWRPFRRSS